MRFPEGDESGIFFRYPAVWHQHPGLGGGGCVGLAARLLAPFPGKKASSVSPLTAVSGNARLPGQMKNMRFSGPVRVDRNLGIYHALENRKNLLPMTVSFALSILMFMSFSGIVDFMHHAVRPLRPLESLIFPW